MVVMMDFQHQNCVTMITHCPLLLKLVVDYHLAPSLCFFPVIRTSGSQHIKLIFLIRTDKSISSQSCFCIVFCHFYRCCQSNFLRSSYSYISFLFLQRDIISHILMGYNKYDILCLLFLATNKVKLRILEVYYMYHLQQPLNLQNLHVLFSVPVTLLHFNLQMFSHEI